MKLRLLSVVAVVTATLLSITAVPARAAAYECWDTGGWPHQHCWVGYQQFPYGQTTGLRSSMQGFADGPNIGVTASQQAGTDEIYVKLRVWDLNEDGYRARVWVDIYKNCWCIYDGNKVRTGPPEHQFSGDVFDAHHNGGTDDYWWYTNAATGATATHYTVRLKLGRYQGSTGRAEWGEEQRYYLTVD